MILSKIIYLLIANSDVDFPNPVVLSKIIYLLTANPNVDFPNPVVLSKIIYQKLKQKKWYSVCYKFA